MTLKIDMQYFSLLKRGRRDRKQELYAVDGYGDRKLSFIYRKLSAVSHIPREMKHLRVSGYVTLLKTSMNYC
jgi:hypothetical protein